MAIAHDASSPSHASGSSSASEASFSWTHTPSGTPKGVLVFTFTGMGAVKTATEHATAVTYGGVSLTAVPSGSAADTATEPMRTTAWFLASSVPTGAQTVQVTRTNNTTSMWAVAITVTSGGDTSTAGVLLEQENQALTEENIDDGSPGANSVRYAAVASGTNNVTTTIGANSTLIQSNVTGQSVSAAVVRETTAGQGSRPVGVTVVGADDVAAVYLAVIEVAGGGGVTVPRFVQHYRNQGFM
jgi:hypothetical protein